jgi:dihydrofolate reductase
VGITIIAAVSQNNIIGNKGTLPWKIPSELQHFKKTTLQKMVVMGRKTYDSIGSLPSRLNVVVTSTLRPGQIILNESTKTYTVCNIEDIQFLKNFIQYNDEIYIIGGNQIYSMFLKTKNNDMKVNTLLLSRIPTIIEGDTQFPKIPAEFKLVNTQIREHFTIEEYKNDN